MRAGKPPVILEVELHTKTKSQECVQTLRGYREAQTIGHIAGVAQFVSDDAALSAKRLSILPYRARKASHQPASMQPAVEVRAIPCAVRRPLAAMRLPGLHFLNYEVISG